MAAAAPRKGPLPLVESAGSTHGNETPRERFDFYGLAVDVTGPDAGVLDDVRRDFTFFQSAAGEAQLTLELLPITPARSALPAVASSVITPRNVCYRDGHVTYIDYFGRGLAVFDRKAQRCVIQSPDRHLLHEAAYLFLLSTVGKHLDRIGLHRVHALGVSYRGAGILLLLPSGGGKSTTALALLQRPDFQLLAEDTPLIDRRGRILPFPLRLGVRPDSNPEVPERYLRTVRRMEFDPKTLIDLEYFKDRLAPAGRPVEARLVLIGQRNLGDVTAIETLSKPQALQSLVKYAVVGLGVYQGLEFLLERGAVELAGKGGLAASRLYASVRVLLRARTHRFVMGRDIERNTRRLIAFIEESCG